MTERDRDAELKVRTARFLWHLGYVSPREAAISGKEIKYGALKRYDLTDIDVVGIRFDSDLTHRTVVADCKSNKTSSVGRLFWLRGLMDFFGADHGYLVQPQIGSEVREVAARLSVSLLDNENLAKYESEKGLQQLHPGCFSVEAYDRESLLWGLRLPKGYQPNDDESKLLRLYRYLSYGYWFNEEYRNVQQLLSVVTEASSAISVHPDKERMKVLLYTSLTLWSISLLKMCGAVMAAKSTDIHNEVRRYIFGGAASASERARLMKLFSSVQKQHIPLEPPYYDDLLELVARIMRYSQFAKDIPRYADLIVGENILCARKGSLDALFGKAFSVDTLKLTKDCAAFIGKTASVDMTLFGDLMSQ